MKKKEIDRKRDKNSDGKRGLGRGGNIENFSKSERPFETKALLFPTYGRLVDSLLSSRVIPTTFSRMVNYVSVLHITRSIQPRTRVSSLSFSLSLFFFFLLSFHLLLAHLSVYFYLFLLFLFLSLVRIFSFSLPVLTTLLSSFARHRYFYHFLSLLLTLPFVLVHVTHFDKIPIETFRTFTSKHYRSFFKIPFFYLFYLTLSNAIEHLSYKLLENCKNFKS